MTDLSLTTPFARMMIFMESMMEIARESEEVQRAYYAAIQDSAETGKFEMVTGQFEAGTHELCRHVEDMCNKGILPKLASHLANCKLLHTWQEVSLETGVVKPAYTFFKSFMQFGPGPGELKGTNLWQTFICNYKGFGLWLALLDDPANHKVFPANYPLSIVQARDLSKIDSVICTDFGAIVGPSLEVVKANIDAGDAETMREQLATFKKKVNDAPIVPCSQWLPTYKKSI